jgi:hypothetical protein
MTDPSAPVNLLFEIQERTVDAGTVFRAERTRHLYRWWSGFEPGPPRRKDFDITEHPSLAAHIFVVECRPDGDFIFRLLGDEVIHIIGRNRTGEVLKPGAVNEYGHNLFDYYTRIARTRRCLLCVGFLKLRDSAVARFESIDCPLTEDDGRIGRIIGVMETLEPLPPA